MPGALPVIVRAELLGARNRLVKRNPARLGILAITLVVAGGFLGGGSLAIGATAGHFLPFALDSLLAAGFTALSLLMLVVGFPTVISSLFVGRDLLQLVVAPVRTRDIFAARLMSAVTANLLLSFILAAGVLGVGAGAGAPWFYYPMALLLIAAQVLVVTALQAILMTVILRWVPAKLARDVAAGVAGLTGAALYLAWNLNLRKTFAGRKGGAPDVSNLTSFFQRIDWLPTTWPGHALSATLQGSVGTSLTWMLATLALGALLVAAAELLYERTLLFGLGVFGAPTAVWRRRKAVPSSRPPPKPSPLRGEGVARPSPQPSPLRGEGWPGPPYRPIAVKDWLGFRRDVRRLTRLLPALLLPLGYAAALSQPARSLSGFWSNVALVTFLSMFLSSALASTSIPTERRGFQLLRLAPLTMWPLLRAQRRCRRDEQERRRPAAGAADLRGLARGRVCIDLGFRRGDRSPLRSHRRPEVGRDRRHAHIDRRVAWVRRHQHRRARPVPFRRAGRGGHRQPRAGSIDAGRRVRDDSGRPPAARGRGCARRHPAHVRKRAAARVRRQHLRNLTVVVRHHDCARGQVRTAVATRHHAAIKGPAWMIPFIPLMGQTCPPALTRMVG